MRPAFDEQEPQRGSRAALYVEDVLILLAVAALFVLTVFFRHTWWGQAGLAVVLGAMLVVFYFRFRRVHKAFTGADGDDL